MKRILGIYPLCSCLMKTDMEKANDVYEFLKEYFWEIDSKKECKQLSPANLKCAYCLLCTALKLAKRNKQKYEKEQIEKLTIAKSIIAKRYFAYAIFKICKSST
ncbi:hypothetical protein [Bacteroides sp.]